MVSLEIIISPFKKRINLLFITLLFAPLILNAKQDIGNSRSTIYAKPFWLKKSYKLSHKYFPKVSVKSTKQKVGNRLHMNGVVNVTTPAKYVYKVGQNLENFRGVSSHLAMVKHNKKTNFAVLKFSAYGYYTTETVKVGYSEDTKNYYVDIVVKYGFFKGANGRLQIAKKTRRNTDVSIQVVFDYKKWPVPKLFIKFGIEVVLQKMASRIKTFLQNNYNKKVGPHG